jgi:hypothetical protein
MLPKHPPLLFAQVLENVHDFLSALFRRILLRLFEPASQPGVSGS